MKSEVTGYGSADDPDMFGWIDVYKGTFLDGEFKCLSLSAKRQAIGGHLGQKDEIDHLLFVRYLPGADDTTRAFDSVKKEHGTIHGVYHGVWGIISPTGRGIEPYATLAAKVVSVKHLSEYAVKITKQISDHPARLL